MSRGVLAIFGPTKQSSINTLNSVTDFYGIPYISWSFLERSKTIIAKETIRRFRNSNCKNSVMVDYGSIRKPRNSDSNREDSNNDDSHNDDESDDILTNDYSINTNEEITSAQIYFRPHIYPVIIELIKHYKWSTIYYIYNHEHGRTHNFILFETNNK